MHGEGLGGATASSLSMCSTMAKAKGIYIRLKSGTSLTDIFAMAKIQRIGHDHQAPFWHLLLLGENQAVTRGENKLPHDYYTLNPQVFTDSEPPIKLLIGG